MLKYPLWVFATRWREGRSDRCLRRPGCRPTDKTTNLCGLADVPPGHWPPVKEVNLRGIHTAIICTADFRENYPRFFHLFISLLSL